MSWAKRSALKIFTAKFQVLKRTVILGGWVRMNNRRWPRDHIRDPVFSWVELNKVGKVPTGRQLLLAFEKRGNILSNPTC